MLMELNKPSQITGENHRRWFYAEDADLIVWEDSSKTIIGFQFCFVIGSKEEAISWRQDKGFLHEVVDNARSNPHSYKMTPLLKQNGGYSINLILDIFSLKSTTIDKHVRDFVKTQFKAH